MHRLVLLPLMLLLAMVASPQPDHRHSQLQPAGWKCRCANQSLCAPLRTPKPDREVFAYYEDHWTNPDYNQTWLDLFSGGTVTTIAACEGHVAQEPGVLDARMSDEHLCYAHAHGVRVVPACIGCDVWSGSPGGLSRCPGHTDKIPFNFNDSAARATYVKNWSSIVHDYGYDGLSLDMEGGIPKSQGAGLTALVRDFRAELGPQSQLSFATACDPHAHWELPSNKKYGPMTFMDFGYQYDKLSPHLDFFFAMCYGNLASKFSNLAHADNPLAALTQTVETFPAAPEKLIVGLPLYFFDYTCDPGTAPNQQLCSIKEFFKTHNPDSSSALNPISLGGVLALAAGKPVGSRKGAVVKLNALNATEGSMYLNYVFPNDNTSTIHQIPYGSPESLAAKYKMLASKKVYGTGFWVSSGRWPDNAPMPTAATQALWRSVQVNFVDGGGQ